MILMKFETGEPAWQIRCLQDAHVRPSGPSLHAAPGGIVAGMSNALLLLSSCQGAVVRFTHA